jgi:uncharacterized protein
MNVDDKMKCLKELLLEMNSLVIAYSGGVDSTFLAVVANDILRQNTLMVTANSLTYPQEELQKARAIAKEMGFRFLEIRTNELANPSFVANTVDRCYHCKRELFGKLREIAFSEDFAWVADGSNRDDLSDYRPGRRAATELGTRSPLCEVGLTKHEIRLLSQKKGLPTWSKPAMACLATRLPYGTPITHEILERIAEGEEYLRSLGIQQIRLRQHGEIARIEVDERDLAFFLNGANRTEIVKQLKSLGYTYVDLDLAGYRSGSMNEAIQAETI